MKKILNLFLYACLLSLAACGGSDNDDDSPRSSSSSNSSSSSSLPTNSSSSSSSSSQTSFGAPQNLSAAAANGSVTLSWSSVPSADNYHVYYATEPGIQPENISAFDDGTWVQNVTAPYVMPSLANGTTYYFVVSAVDGDVESAPSAEVSATPSVVDVAGQPTAQEVLVLELVNRARFDPAAEADLYDIGLNDGLDAGTISPSRKSPLAFNLDLIEAARNHSQWMLDEDVFSHDGINGSSPGQRMQSAGYVFSGTWTWGENIAWSGNSGNSIDLTRSAYGHHEGLFKSPGHRENIMGEDFREIGIGQKDGYFAADGRNWRASMITENFARSGSRYFLTGVVYNDANGDNFYNVGEGLNNVTITVDGESHLVFNTGAYVVPVGNGTYDLSFSGAALGSPVNYTVEVNGANVKVDVIKSGNSINVNSW